MDAIRNVVELAADLEENDFYHDLDNCSECGNELDLDGYDGLCGNCADRAEFD